MRIGVDATSLICAEPRGEGKSLLRLYREIASLRPDITIVLFGAASAKSSDRWRTIPRAEVVSFDVPGYRWNAWENVGLPWHAMRAGCDVLHCASSGGPRFSAVPVVMTVHDLIPVLIDDYQNTREREYFRRRITNGMRIASEVIAVSAHTQLDLARCFPDSRVPVHVIHWGSDSLDDDGTRPIKADYVLALGGASPRKNVASVVQAFARMSAENASIRLVILGMGQPELRNGLRQMAFDLGIADQLDIPGFVSESELAAWYRHAICLCYPSFYEGFGLPLLEAMSCGVPVVASARSSIPEVVADGGILIEPDDLSSIANALRELTTNVERRRELALKARARADSFSWRRTAEQTVDLLTRAAVRG